MSRLLSSSTLPVKPEPSREVSDSFKSLKKSLKDTLERLETIGISDIEAPDELISLKAQLAQKDKLINEQAQMIEKLSGQVTVFANSSRTGNDVPAELSRLISNCFVKLQETPEFAETVKISQPQLISLVKSKKTEMALVGVLTTFNEYMEYCRIKPQGAKMELMESYDARNFKMCKSSSIVSGYSDLDQEISDQKRIFSNLCKEIAQSLNPDMMELGSELEEN